MDVYQVRGDPTEGWQDASKERYDVVGRVMELPQRLFGPRWERRRLVLPLEGYVLAPINPTQEMLDVVCTADGREPWTDKTMRDTYQTMLAARPEVKP